MSAGGGQGARRPRMYVPSEKRVERELHQATRERDRERDRAYKAGYAGEEYPFEGRDDDELFELYNAGHDDRDTHAGEDRARGGTAPPPTRLARARSTGQRVRSASRGPVRSTRRAARAVATGGSPSALGILGLMFGLVLLYLLLANASIVAAAIDGTRKFFMWLVDPHATVPPQGGGS